MTIPAMVRLLMSGLSVCAGTVVAALPLDFPGNARLDREIVTPLGRYALPTAPWADGFLPTVQRDGELTQQVWHIEAAALTTLQLILRLRQELETEGFVVIFECATEDCGGFDFRLSTLILPPPEMFVDLADFRFLSATRGDEALSLLISRTSAAGFVQVTRIGPPVEPGTVAASTAPPLRATGPVVAGGDPASPALPGDFGATLDAVGRIVLSDLAFATGSAQLADGDFLSLQHLADYLTTNPSRRVALVGHTDSEGSLDANIALSKRRAGSVLERLVADYGIPRQQLEAEGMGYLSPVATNLTQTGRDANRRVEVIVISTE